MQTRLDLLTRALPEFQGRDSGTRAVPVLGEGESSFGSALTKALNGVSEARDNATSLTERFARGENVELHQVMAASEEAGIELDMLVEMRNKILEAYRTVINMQS